MKLFLKNGLFYFFLDELYFFHKKFNFFFFFFFYLLLGYFSLAELESVKGPMGLPIERDEHFKPKTLQEIKGYYEGKGWGI